MKVRERVQAMMAAVEEEKNPTRSIEMLVQNTHQLFAEAMHEDRGKGGYATLITLRDHLAFVRGRLVTATQANTQEADKSDGRQDSSGQHEASSGEHSDAQQEAGVRGDIGK